jgi:hypothetical protein
MIVLDGPRELTNLLPVDLEVVRVPVVGSDDVSAMPMLAASPLMY